MVCIYCSADTKVINSRHQKRNNTVWRRRRCVECGSVITTEEKPRYETALMVSEAEGSLQPFSRDILLISLYKSLAHRKTAAEDAAALSQTLIGALRTQAAVINKAALITQVADCLDRFDPAAGTHYRAYHGAAATNS